MRIRFKDINLFSLIFFTHLLFSYYFFQGWWYSCLGSVIIIFLSFLLWKNNFLQMTGLNIGFKIFLKSIVLAAVIASASYALMNWIGKDSNIKISFTQWQNYFHDVFYILNEEIVLGAIILFSIQKRYAISPALLSIFLALLFSLMHFVFYKWVFLNKGILDWSTMFVLFLVGFIRNNLIIFTKHIGYSWALHFGWMVIMLGCNHYNQDSEKYLTELDRFNIYLGSAHMLIVSIVLSVLSFLLLVKNTKKKR